MTVYLVGAGPGDPGLLTRRATELLARADVVVHDRLIDPEVLALAAPGAQLVDVGKAPGQPGGPRQEQINELLVRVGGPGRLVVRLKGGDPFVFGRGGEEALALALAGVEWEVVPGVSSAFGVPATAGIPVTHRGLSTSVTVVTGHVGDHTSSGGVDWAALARAGGTLVILMGMATKGEIARRLMEAGRSADTPVKVVGRGTTPDQRVARTTLGGLGDVDLGSPAIIVIGEVAALELGVPPPLGPLTGCTVVVTRPAHQAGPTRAALEAAGAAVLVVPATAIGDAQDGGSALRIAAARVGDFDWVVLTSANAVQRLLDAVDDLRSLAGVRLAAVGRATAEALRSRGLVADLVASPANAEGLVEAMPPPSGGSRVLYPRAAGARPTLSSGLGAKGFEVEEVEAYRTLPAPAPPEAVAAALEGADSVVFAAPSAIDGYLAMRRPQGAPLPLPPLVVCIGPVTAQAARGRGLAVAAVAAEPTPGALVEALVAQRRP